MTPRSYRLSLLTFDSRGRLLYRPDALLRVDERGRFWRVGPVPRRVPRGTSDWRGRLAIPGLVDAHCHLSQYPAVGADGSELLPWLRKNIFPLEKGFRGERARPLARDFFGELAAHGTTTAAVYTSIWRDSTEVCFEEALRSGLRVIMGKVMMDRRSYDSRFAAHHRGKSRTQVSLEQSLDLCRRWHGRGGGRIQYAFTPRFALSCSEALLSGAARLAAEHGAYIQTHLAENRREVEEVRRAFPEARDYTSVYHRAGMLGPRTILAHCIWLKEREYRLIEKTGSAVAHCPTANAFLASGVMDLARMRRGAIPVALGTDVAAGPTLCLFEVMRQAVYGQRLARAHGLFSRTPQHTAEKAFYMATLGGARALSLGERTGSIERGKQADFVVLDPSRFSPSGIRALDPGRVLSRMVYRAGRSAVVAVFVDGRRVSTGSRKYPS